jgi:hypothetical protein
MIGTLHSRCKNPLVEVLGVASDTGHQGSTKGKAEAGRSFLYLGGIRTLSPHSFYLLCHSRF